MKVTVFTQIYNAKPYLAQCLESVLNQTFSDFEYILIDNGCTDGSSEIIREYAQKDSRIKLFSFEVNKPEARWLNIIRENGKGEYITDVDPDDWLEPNYLECLVSLADSSGADVACTGSFFYQEGVGVTGTRSLSRRMVFERSQFAELFPQYHVFFRTYWAKLFRMETFRKAAFPDFSKFGTLYGWDTLISFSILRQSDKVYMDDSILHHYRIHKQSDSYRYDPRRFVSDTFLYEHALAFLSDFGPVSERNRHFLALVYASAIRDTAEMLSSSHLTKAEKMEKYRAIAEHSITKEVYRHSDAAARSRMELLHASVAAYDDSSAQDFYAVLRALCPKCAPVVSREFLSLSSLKDEFAVALLGDDPDTILSALLNMLRANEQSKKFDLAAMIQALSANKPLLKDIDDKKFLRRHGEIYLMAWQERYGEALDKMTEMLLDGERADETFLRLYLSLAALQNQPSAFIFGKVRLAQHYLRKGDKASCRAVVEELAEMGVEDNDEILELKRVLV